MKKFSIFYQLALVVLILFAFLPGQKTIQLRRGKKPPSRRFFRVF